jgi:mannose-6-phosphate isomerase-like protein (cupin superfamily)
VKAISRRDLCIAISTFIRAGSATTAQAASRLEFETSGKAVLSDSQVFSLDRIQAATRANGAKSWDILHGGLATGEAISVHESLQPAGIAPSPPHAIQHSELILVQEGTLLVEHEGKSEKVSSGGVVFVSRGTMHAARNVGNGPAKYLVVSIGGDTR